MKEIRHQRILKIISNTNVKTQEELTQFLKEENFDVTQATVSRDIKELGLIKRALPDGSYKYDVSHDQMADNYEQIELYSNSILAIRYAMNNIVIRTYPGMASAVAASLDSILGHQVLGTIAGDDTILIILESESDAKAMLGRLYKMFKRKE